MEGNRGEIIKIEVYKGKFVKFAGTLKCDRFWHVPKPTYFNL